VLQKVRICIFLGLAVSGKWNSSYQVTLDLRYSTSSSSPSLPIAGGSAGSQENPLERSPKETSQEKSPNSSSPSPRPALSWLFAHFCPETSQKANSK